jgi:hypothetical protein
MLEESKSSALQQYSRCYLINVQEVTLRYAAAHYLKKGCIVHWYNQSDTRIKTVGALVGVKPYCKLLL